MNLKSTLLGVLGSTLLSSMLMGKSGKGFVRAGYGSKGSSLKKKDSIPPHSLTNFEMQMYYQNEPRFNGVYSRDNLPD